MGPAGCISCLSGMSDSDEDDHLWSRVTQGVTPLRSRNRVVMGETPDTVRIEQKPAKKKKPSTVSLQALKTGANVPPAAPPGHPPLEIGASAGVDKRTAERLRRGKMVLDGRLDLHGMTQARAHSALTLFVDTAYQADKRCLLVITGKGQGILKRAVPIWLGDPFLRPKILSVMTAQREHGGDGALYVLLRRRRL